MAGDYMSEERIAVLETHYPHIMEGIDDLKELLKTNSHEHKTMLSSINNVTNRITVTEQNMVNVEKKIDKTQGEIDLVKKDIKDWKTWVIKWLIGTGGAASGITFTILTVLS